jgi:catechol 2,3-dioxygenase-like lactoylglutathione lyase family enzyme
MRFIRRALIGLFVIAGLVTFGLYDSVGDDAAQTQAAGPPFAWGEVSHLMWVVRDLDAVVDYWEGIGLGKVQVTERLELQDLVYRGKPVEATVKQGWCSIGGVGVEIFQPLEGRSAFGEFLERHGDDIHNVTFQMKSIAELESRVDWFDGIGVGVLERGTFPTPDGKGVYFYLDTADVGGMVFELAYNPQYLKNQRSGTALEDDNKYPFGKIVQYATVVEDIDKVAEFYNRIGFTVTRIDRDNKGLIRRYRGEEEDLRMHMGWSKLGSVTLEILQPTKGRSIYDEYLKSHGEGFHHIAFSVDDMDRAVKVFTERGVVISQDGAWGQTEVAGRFAYTDTDHMGGLTLELLWSK